MTSQPARLGLRAASLTTAVLAGAVVLAAPASAHVDITAEGAQAGAGPVTLSFSAASESQSAGIVGIKTQLLAGIAPSAVTLASGPEGWALTPTEAGFELAGPGIEPGVAAEYSVTVAQLPAGATELAFPTLQLYSDGVEDAWIDPVTDAVPNPAKPAPVLAVAPAAAGAAPVPAPTATSASPSASATPSAAAETSAAAPAAQGQDVSAAPGNVDESSSRTPVIVLSVVVLFALAAAWVVRRRRT